MKTTVTILTTFDHETSLMTKLKALEWKHEMEYLVSDKEDRDYILGKIDMCKELMGDIEEVMENVDF